MKPRAVQRSHTFAGSIVQGLVAIALQRVHPVCLIVEMSHPSFIHACPRIVSRTHVQSISWQHAPRLGSSPSETPGALKQRTESGQKHNRKKGNVQKARLNPVLLYCEIQVQMQSVTWLSQLLRVAEGPRRWWRRWRLEVASVLAIRRFQSVGRQCEEMVRTDKLNKLQGVH